MHLETGALKVHTLLVFTQIVFGNVRVLSTQTLYVCIDVGLKILRDDSACPGACQVIQW